MTLLHRAHTHKDDAHHEDDHADDSGEGNQVVRDGKGELWFEDDVRSAEPEKTRSIRHRRRHQNMQQRFSV